MSLQPVALIGDKTQQQHYPLLWLTSCFIEVKNNRFVSSVFDIRLVGSKWTALFAVADRKMVHPNLQIQQISV
jgi:hypothetical protein